MPDSAPPTYSAAPASGLLRMVALLWFLSGCVVAVVISRGIAARRAPTSDSPDEVDTTAAPHQPLATVEPRRYEITESRTLADLSASLGTELAGLTSGVEGQAQLLCETLGHPSEVAARAEQLWESVRRLRFFCEKMQSFAKVGELTLVPTDVRQLLAALTHEIEDYSHGCLQVGLHIAPSLPFAMGNADALRIAVLFLIEGVMELESDANSLLLQARSHENEEDTLTVRIDIEAVPDESSRTTAPTTPLIHFSCLAARNLLTAQGASFTLDHTPGLNALASVTLVATDQPRIPSSTASGAEPTVIPTAVPTAVEPAIAHQFGGVLVMEGNSTIRDMLARELKKTGRNVIACADGVAARSLFEATPERFELLILERSSRRLPGEELARLAIERDPRLRIVMIHAGAGVPSPPDLRAHTDLTILHKPFGLMELRDCLARVLAPRLPPRSAHQPCGTRNS